MKTIELYTVEWRDGYERHTEHDVSLDTMRSWFEDGGGEALTNMQMSLR